ncbi:rod shape-determining protein MreC [Planobispora rosea]|uniref:Cell shape-determining protein MreC n=1 Tax=Planobispora rosea TaxID=35762 RepID=A0A8J3RY33_PLARO|nr:rod shape-determining protein MreC [Planobispora rosea]GGS54324.1 rod shape-determining protein MreC [Planobispora rosea]GIH82735.1 rod shape-determining protein MreC [Planobispora rosea]
MRVIRRHRLVLALAVTASAVLITLDVRDGTTALREWAASVAGPVQRLVAAIGRAPAGGEQRVRLAAARWTAQAMDGRNRRAEPIRTAPPRRPVATGQVIAFGAHGDTVAVDVGTRDGVHSGQMVVNADGLVGLVIEAGHSVSTVRLAADPASSVGVRVAGSREIGIVTGQGVRNGLLRLRLLAADAELRAGQRVETLGSAKAGPYLPGVPVGTVVRVEAGADPLVTTALVRPAVRFTALDVVGVTLGGGRAD